MAVEITELNSEAARQNLRALSEVLIENVRDGAAVSFMAPLAQEAADRFWLNDVIPEVEKGRRVLFVAEYEGNVVGIVQLLTAMPPNQPHRCELAKMMVHPRARRMGIGRALVQRAIQQAQEMGKTLLTLDTKTGDAAQALYASLGFVEAGAIPDYALDPDGRTLASATYMYKYL
jgi:ribosomal protein S18 acetylase RimI-like enzyme